MAKPDFLVIGAQKAGTTWLDEMFKGHHEVWTPMVKELQFFNELYMPKAFKWTQKHRSEHAKKAAKYVFENKEAFNWEHIAQAIQIGRGNTIDYDWYESIFDFAPENCIKGEMTPEYSLLSEEHVLEVFARFPKLKIILVIRDPIERAISGIKMRLLQQGFTSNSSQDEIDSFVFQAASDWDVIERSNYERIISIWGKYVLKGNFLVLSSSDLRSNPLDVLNLLASFLEITADSFSRDPSQQVHVGSKFNISQQALDEVRKNQESNLKWFKRHHSSFQISSKA